MSVAFDKHAPRLKGVTFRRFKPGFEKFLLLPEQQFFKCSERIRQFDNKNRTVRAIRIGALSRLT